MSIKEYDFSNLFTSKHEEAIHVLGTNYVESLLRNNMLANTAFILSSKRLYQIGRSLDDGGKTKSNKSTIVNIEDVTGVNVHMNDPIFLKYISIAIIVFGLLFTLMGALSSAPETTAMGIVMIPISPLPFIVYMLARKKYLIIQYAGGAIMAEHGQYSEEEIKAFQKAIFIQKETLEEEKEEQPTQNIPTKAAMDFTDELKQLATLKEQGILTEKEFELKKKQILNL